MKKLIMTCLCIFSCTVFGQDIRLEFKNLDVIAKSLALGPINLESSTLVMSSGQVYHIKNSENFDINNVGIGARTRHCAKLDQSTGLYLETFDGVKVGMNSRIQANSDLNSQGSIIGFSGNAIAIRTSMTTGASVNLSYGPSLQIDLSNKRRLRVGSSISLVGISVPRIGLNTGIGLSLNSRSMKRRASSDILNAEQINSEFNTQKQEQTFSQPLDSGLPNLPNKGFNAENSGVKPRFANIVIEYINPEGDLLKRVVFEGGANGKGVLNLRFQADLDDFKEFAFSTCTEVNQVSRGGQPSKSQRYDISIRTPLNEINKPKRTVEF